jgi:hypothetical protein
MEAVRLADHSQLTLELESGASMNISVVATARGPVMAVESTGAIPGY